MLHWIIYAELRKFVEAKLGTEAWDELLVAAQLGTKKFLQGGAYPDEDAVAIVSAASRRTGKPVSALLEAFGEFIVPDLAKFYAHLLRPEWRTLDVVENVEATIHTIIRLRDQDARPPEIKVRRLGPAQIEVTYSSARKMCGVAKGIIAGLAKGFNEKVFVEELGCMTNGAACCTIKATLLA